MGSLSDPDLGSKKIGYAIFHSAIRNLQNSLNRHVAGIYLIKRQFADTED